MAYAQVLPLAQAFEDAGARAYKGQATSLLGTDFLIQTADTFCKGKGLPLR